MVIKFYEQWRLVGNILSREIYLRWKTYNQVFFIYSLWPEDQGKPKLFLMYDKVSEAKTQFFSFCLFISLCQGLSVCVCVYLYVCMCIKSRFYKEDSWIGLDLSSLSFACLPWTPSKITNLICKNFYWSIVDLQCCVSFKCIAGESVIQMHISTL